MTHDPSRRTETRETGRLLGLLAVVLLTRALPALIWRDLPPIHDEVFYATIAQGLLHGRGIEPTLHGFLWAPLYPAFLALHGWIFGSIASARATQVLLSVPIAFLVYRLGCRLGGPRIGLCAGVLYALEPTLLAFSHYLFSEHLYTLWLLLALEGALWARNRPVVASVAPGVALGLAVLTRGVGAYALPVIVPALLWRRFGDGRAWGRTLLFTLAAAGVVLPYSYYASRKFGGAILVDATAGFNMWLGNNEFDPVSFDYQMGGDTLLGLDDPRLAGRRACWPGLTLSEKNRCEVSNGLAFIREHPALFIWRIGIREAQTFNPTSFLLRNLRGGRYEGMPARLASALCLLVIVSHFLVVGTAALGAAAAGAGAGRRSAANSLAATPLGSPAASETVEASESRSAFIVAAWGLTLYHLAACGVTIGMSRFRVPLLPIWIPFSALLIAAPSASIERLRRAPTWAAFGAFLLILVVALSLVYLPRAFPAA